MNESILFLKTSRLSELLIDQSRFLDSVIEHREKVFLKKLWLKQKRQKQPFTDVLQNVL